MTATTLPGSHACWKSVAHIRARGGWEALRKMLATTLLPKSIIVTATSARKHYAKGCRRVRLRIKSFLPAASLVAFAQHAPDDWLPTGTYYLNPFTPVTRATVEVTNSQPDDLLRPHYVDQAIRKFLI